MFLTVTYVQTRRDRGPCMKFNYSTNILSGMNYSVETLRASVDEV